MTQHLATASFWKLYEGLPAKTQKLADKNFELLKVDARHPSLRFKKVGKIWSVRVGLDFRALAIPDDKGFIWFWIGNHSDYEQLLK